jgi:hypothetical protein
MSTAAMPALRAGARAIGVALEDAAARAKEQPQVDAATEFRNVARQFGMNFETTRPRVILSFPQNANDMLLSGTMANGRFL